MQIHFSYCLDAVGNLIRLSLGHYPDALIPDAAELVTTADDLAHPKPWTVTISSAIEQIRFVPVAFVSGTHAEQIHRKGTLPHTPYVFVPPVDAFAPDDEIEQLLDLYGELPKDHEGRNEILYAMKTIGIVPLPVIPEFNLLLHEPSEVRPISGYAKEGWISHTRVYRKAIVGRS